MTANVELAEWISDLSDRKASASEGEIWAKVKEFRASVAHELAEKIRAEALAQRAKSYSDNAVFELVGSKRSADIIDPEVTT